MACGSCDTITSKTNFSVSVNYPTDIITSGAKFNITVTMDPGILILGGTFQVCLYKSGQAVQSQTLVYGIQIGGTQTATFNIVMGNTDSNFIVNIFDTGIFGGCIYSQGFVVYACVPTWQCEQGTTGYQTDGCGNRQQNNICNTPGAVLPIIKPGTAIDTTCDTTSNIDFSKYGLSFLGCRSKSEVTVAGIGLIVLVAVLGRR